MNPTLAAKNRVKDGAPSPIVDLAKPKATWPTRQSKPKARNQTVSSNFPEYFNSNYKLGRYKTLHAERIRHKLNTGKRSGPHF